MSRISRDPRSIVLAAIILCIVASLTGARGEDKNAGGLKVAVIDMHRIISEYKYAKTSDDELHKINQDTLTVLQVWQQNVLLPAADQQLLGDLTLEEATPAGLDAAKKAQKAKLMEESRALFDEQAVLSAKQQPTPQEQDRLRALVKADADSKKRVVDKSQAVQQELEKKLADANAKVNKDVHDALNKVGKAKGYNLVFNSEVLLYADSDITDEVLKELNK